MSHDAAVDYITSLLRFPVQETTVSLVRAAFASRARWQISYWDAAIVEADRTLRCDTLYSEDVQHGQDFDGVRVVNPFL